MTSLTTLKNIGPKTIGWLEDVGIDSVEALEVLGAVEAYLRIKRHYPEKVTLNALWGLYSALTGIPWNHLPDDIKADLRRQVEEAE